MAKRVVTLDLCEEFFKIGNFEQRFFKMKLPDGLEIRQGDILRVKGMGLLEVYRVLDGGNHAIWLDAKFI